MTNVYAKERNLYREVAQKVETALPDVEVLAVELLSPTRFCVYVDRVGGSVDHALCERVTNVLRGYLDEFAIDVSSPGLERPLRKPAHFSNAVGRKIALRTAAEIHGRKRFRGELVSAGERTVTLATGGENPIDIPYEAIVRGNLIDEG
jgi:ribosome maturation factor RimP